VRTALVVLALLAAVAAVALLLGGRRWASATAAAVARLHASGGGAAPAAFRAAELEGLPAPVSRYLAAALRDGQPIPRRLRLEWEGDFLLSPPDGWAPFTATQAVAIRPGGFVWDARIRMAPGVAVRVRDGFAHGRGSMRAEVIALLPVVSVEGTPEIATAALQRWLAEAVWYPAALLPSQGTEWAALDATSARATVRVAGVTASIDFHFGGDGLVERLYAAERGRDVNGRSVPTPWEARVHSWGERAGARVPLAGEVAWLLPEGRQAYWRGRLVGIAFD
jgi:hypothetical protein